MREDWRLRSLLSLVVKAKGSVDASGGGQHLCDAHDTSRRFLFVG